MAVKGFAFKQAAGASEKARVGVREATDNSGAVNDVVRVEIRNIYDGLTTDQKNAIKAVTLGDLIDMTPGTEFEDV